MRIVTAIWLAILLVPVIAAEVVIPGWHGVVAVPYLLLASAILLRLPQRRWQARGYVMADERLRVVRGLLFHSDTVVPFGRVQHIDVDQGPLERAYEIATLTVHTAGSHNASVHLPGLKHADALAMRDAIRAAIRRDTL
ncbi:MAG: PH domain-containing protein [Alphaproteobacteria bacterium]|nr:PH domain-containing protein [Alphaproteobacteria bacterium]MBU1606045.1 PH domain-containing protein [Alphaproteobacteria bacterium]